MEARARRVEPGGQRQESRGRYQEQDQGKALRERQINM